MRNPTGLLALEADIQRAELTLEDRRLRLRQHALRARAVMRERVRGTARPMMMMAGAGAAALWLLGRVGRSRGREAPRASARTAAFAAPLVTRLLAPTLGRDMATLISTMVVPFAFSSGTNRPRTAPLVRPSRYLGHWFEVAHLQRSLTGEPAQDVSTTWLPVEGSGGRRMRVVSRRRLPDGRVEQQDGEARLLRGSGNAKMKVTYAQGLMRLLPWAWADYWILDVAPDYSSALVGTPDRKRLWLLGREPDLDQPILERMVTRAAAQGYDVGKLVGTEHQRPSTARTLKSIRRSR